MKLSVIASLLIFWNCLLQNCYGQVCDESNDIKVRVEHFRNANVTANISWCTPRNLHGASHNFKHILIITCDHSSNGAYTNRYEVKERGRTLLVNNLPCGRSCHVNVSLDNGNLVQQMDFSTTLTLMPIAEVFSQNDIQENVSLLVKSENNISMTCGSPQSLVLNIMTGETKSSLHFTNWAWDQDGDIILDRVLSNCDLPKNVSVHYYNSSPNAEVAEQNSSLTTLVPVTRQNLVIEGAVMYTDTTYVWVNYSSVGICDPLVWQLGYSVGGEEIIVNYTSIYSTHVLELKSNRTAPISTIRGRVLFTTGDDRNASSQLDVFEGEWSDEYPLPAFPVIRHNSTINSNVCLHVHLPESPAKLKYVKFNYTEKNQVRSTCIEWNDSTLVNDIVCYVVIGCNVQVAVVTALGDVNVTSEWMSVPTNPCPIDGPDITTIAIAVSLIILIVLLTTCAMILYCVVKKYRCAEDMDMTKMLTLERESHYARYVNPGHVEFDAETVYDEPIPPESTSYTCTPVHYTIQHDHYTSVSTSATTSASSSANNSAITSASTIISTV